MEAARTETERASLGFRSRFRPSRSPVVNVMLAALALLIVGTAISLFKLWPQGPIPRPKALVVQSSQGAIVDRVVDTPCKTSPTGTCRSVTAKIRDGRNKGTRTSFRIFPVPGLAEPKVGDAIRIIRNPPPQRARR